MRVDAFSHFIEHLVCIQYIQYVLQFPCYMIESSLAAPHFASAQLPMDGQDIIVWGKERLGQLIVYNLVFVQRIARQSIYQEVWLLALCETNSIA